MPRDRDVGIMAHVYYSFSREEEESSWFNIDPVSGEVSLAEDLPDTHLNQPTTLVVRATQVDNPDRYALTTMTLSRRGYYSTQLQFIQRDYVATVLESLPVHSLIAPTLINKNTKENIKFELCGDGDGVFRVTPTGQIMLQHPLDFETQQEYSLHVYVSDGVFNDTASLKVQVLNVNDWDPRFKFPQYEFYVGTDTVRPGDAVGNVEVADGDHGDHITLTVMGQDAQMFAISNDGELRIRDLSTLNSTEAHIVVRAKDSGIPPRTASSPITIHFPLGLVRSSPLAVSSSFLLVVIFGSLLALFILVIICLAVYIHKNKKCGDDNDAALPTKMSHIVSNNIPHTKLDPLSPLNHQMQGNIRRHHLTQHSDPTDPNDLTHAPPPLAGIESPTPPDNNNTHAHTNNNDYNNGTVRTSTISVRSAALRNPLANGSLLPTTTTTTTTTASTTTTTPCNSAHHLSGYIVGGVGGDGVSLNGTVRSLSCSTASLTATPEPVVHTPRSYQGSGTLRPQSGLSENDHCFSPAMGAMSKSGSPGGSARAVGGLPTRNRVGPVPPTPPVPSNTPYPEPPSSPVGSLSGSLWPQGSIPKRVKKLSWEDELSNKQKGQVVATSQPGRVVATSQPGQVVATSQPGQVVATSQPGQVVATSQPGRVVATSQPGQVVATSQPGQVVATSQPGQVVATSQPGQVVATSQPGRVVATSQPGQVVATSQPGQVVATSQPGRVVATSQPGQVVATSQPGQVVATSQPGQVVATSQPGQVVATSQPGQVVATSQPGQVVATSQPGQVVATSQPGQVVATSQPGQVVATSQPGQVVATSQPGQVVATSQPGQVVATSQPGQVVATSQPGQVVATSQPGRTELDPEVSVTPMPHSTSDTPNLTVYF
ncbi:hypothetical protein Pmani_037225 [Petrolisthes manimaculis]|uniref:Cadherin domain-containing protein n=1 Tax=Petrolisthes manimaculis TaxID=1843537 RepID=A0AAE1TLN2_9EUCA|nr:hypothetical protein Pmani_037225 [Petrolisthes manimaculis]